VDQEQRLDISVVMACLNEAETIGECIEKAFQVFKEARLEGEVLVVDNGSTDASCEIAKEKGARVVFESRKGYGSAYKKGLSEARGELFVMGDADGTYDFSELCKIIDPLKNGADVVIGSRLNGKIHPGAMSWMKLALGNRISTRLINTFFGLQLTDSQSGFRAFRRSQLQNIPFFSKSMAFATEMIISAHRKGLRISEVPITYYPRRGSASKFKVFQDSLSILHLILSQGFHSNGKSNGT